MEAKDDVIPIWVRRIGHERHAQRHLPAQRLIETSVAELFVAKSKIEGSQFILDVGDESRAV
jgi:hypothetical protein